MEKEAANHIYNILIKLSDEELFKFVEDKKIYNNVKMKHLAKSLGIKHQNYNNDELKRKIVFEFINKLLCKNKEYYNPNELVNVKINEEQFMKAIDDISKKSIYFKNESEYWNLFFDTEYKPTIAYNNKYYFNTMKSILELYSIHLRKKNIKSGGVSKCIYILSIDKNIKKIADHDFNE